MCVCVISIRTFLHARDYTSSGLRRFSSQFWYFLSHCDVSVFNYNIHPNIYSGMAALPLLTFCLTSQFALISKTAHHLTALVCDIPGTGALLSYWTDKSWAVSPSNDTENIWILLRRILNFTWKCPQPFMVVYNKCVNVNRVLARKIKAVSKSIIKYFT